MNVEQTKALFPEALRGLLSFEQIADFIVIKPRQFLGTENFSDISRIVRSNRGEYISAGKDSHFRIPVNSAPTPEEPPRQPPENLHFKVTKLTVALGTTIQQGEREWTKQRYGLEVEVNSDVRDIVEKAKSEAEQLVHSWLTEPPLPTGIPHIDMAELNSAPWLTYKTKEPAETGQAGWIKNPVEFTSWKDPPNALLTLVAAMKRSPNQKLVLGNMEFSFSGEGKFISRRPVKPEA